MITLDTTPMSGALARVTVALRALGASLGAPALSDLGQVPDTTIATRLGIPLCRVRSRRHALGIPAYSGPRIGVGRPRGVRMGRATPLELEAILAPIVPAGLASDGALSEAGWRWVAAHAGVGAHTIASWRRDGLTWAALARLIGTIEREKARAGVR